MNRAKRLTGIAKIALGCALLAALTGCPPSEGQPGAGGGYYETAGPTEGSYGVIRNESDFYEPLSRYGRWEDIGPDGRCWIPTGVAADWSPYSNGYWQETDAGWYWASDEPWGWATYHYGRWNSSPQYGWYWVPQTQWAPAWVSWREGGGYVGWAPLGSRMRAGDRDRPAHGYVFAEERHFTDPIRSQTAAANHNFFDRTADITRTRTVNRTVINEGPEAVVIEHASGRRIQSAPVRELRNKDEARFVAKHPPSPPTRTKDVQSPALKGTAPPEQRAIPARENRQIEKPVSTNAEPRQPAAKRNDQQAEQGRVAKRAEENRLRQQQETRQAEQDRVAKLAAEARVQEQKESLKSVVPPPNNSKPEVAKPVAKPVQNLVEKRRNKPAKSVEKPDERTQQTAEPHAGPVPPADDQDRKNAPRDDQKQKDQS